MSALFAVVNPNALCRGLVLLGAHCKVGWTGIVPLKAEKMATRMVQMMTGSLIDVDQVCFGAFQGRTRLHDENLV